MKMYKKVALWTYLLCFVCVGAFAQKGGIYGKILDSDNLELPFANIAIYTPSGGLVTGSQTDVMGAYSIDLDNGTYRMEASYVGYEKAVQNVTIAGAKQEVNLTLGSITALDEIVVTGGKYEKRIAEETVTIETIKPDLIENSNAPDLEKGVEKVPGVNIIGGQANIRGGSGFSYGAGSRVSLLLDGIPIVTGDSGFPYWDLIPIESVGQVEIIKGAASALYGSSALNGIINVRTAYPESDPKTTISVFGAGVQAPRDNYLGQDENGNDLYKHWWKGETPPFNSGVSFFHSRRAGQWQLLAGGYGFYQKGWRATELTRRARVNGGARYNFKKVEGLAAGVNFIYQYNNGGSYLLWNQGTKAIDGVRPAGTAYELWTALDTTLTRRDQLSIDPYISYTTNSGMKLNWRGRWFKNDNITNTNQSIKSDVFYNELQFQKIMDSLAMVVNFGVVNQLGYADAELYRTEDGDSLFSSQNVGIYAQIDKKFFNKLNTSFGARYEFNKMNTDSAWSQLPVFRFGLNYEVAQATFVRASFGQGYRYPTIAERHVRTDLGGLVIIGNTGLEFETGWSAEIGLKQGVLLGKNFKGFIDVAGFWTEYQNMMEFILSGDIPGEILPGFYTQNVGIDTRISGAECTIAGKGDLSEKWTIGALAGYTYIDPIYKGQGDTLTAEVVELTGSSSNKNILKYRFQHTAKIDVQVEYQKRFSIGFAARYNSFMEAIDEAFLDSTLSLGLDEWREEHDQGSLVVDARIAYQMNTRNRISLLCNNIFNLEYTVRPALIESPRSFGFKYTYSIDPDKEIKPKNL